MTLKFTGPARRNINAIVGYIAKDSPKASEQFANDLSRKFAALAGAPLIGREHDDYGTGIRTFPFGNYMIFYRPMTEGIIIRGGPVRLAKLAAWLSYRRVDFMPPSRWPTPCPGHAPDTVSAGVDDTPHLAFVQPGMKAACRRCRSRPTGSPRLEARSRSRRRADRRIRISRTATGVR